MIYNLGMWKKLNGLLARDRRAAWAAGICLLAIIGWADYATGIEYGFGLFHLIPIALLTWHLGIGPGLFMSALAAGAWAVADLLPRLASGSAFPRLHVTLWNAAVALGLFIFMTAIISQLKKALEHEKALARLKAELLSLVSHEFNNSLTSMGMALLLLRENDDAPDQRRRIYPVLERIHRILKTTVSNFLNQARMQSGRFQLDIKQCELRRVVRDTLDLMAPLSEQKELDLYLEFPEETIPVNADPDALALVMSNLIGNAIKYTPNKGRVTVRLKPADSEPEVEVSVEDTGIGIAAQDRDAIFAGFYRTREGKKEAKGFGMGLKICREILETHGSFLKVESEPGRGSRFYFRLPICPPDCPHRNAGLCHRCRRRNPLILQGIYDGGIPPDVPKIPAPPS